MSVGEVVCVADRVVDGGYGGGAGFHGFRPECSVDGAGGLTRSRWRQMVDAVVGCIRC